MDDESQSTSEDIHNADETRSIPLDSDRTIHFIIPEAWTGDVESAVSLLHDDAVGDELEVPVDCGDVLEDLSV